MASLLAIIDRIAVKPAGSKVETPKDSPKAGTWAWAVEQMRASKRVKRHDWTSPGNDLYLDTAKRMVLGDRAVALWPYLSDVDATDWEVVQPPEPQHRPCVCGGGVRWLTNRDRMRVECTCGRCGPWAPTEAEAWQAWDGKA